MKFITTFLFTLFFFQINAQIWDRTLTDSIGIRSVSPTADGGCIIMGNRIGSLKLAVLKVDVAGKAQWSKDFTDISTPTEPYPSDKLRISQDSDGNYWFGISQYYNGSGSIISKLDKNGNRLILRNLPLINLEINVLNNQVVLFGTSGNGATLMRLNANGDTLNNSLVPSIKFQRGPFYISAVKNNELLIYHLNDTFPRPQTTRIGFDGTIRGINVLSSNNTPFISPYPYSHITKASDGSYFVADSINIVKIDSLGQFLWRKPIAVLNPSIYNQFYYNYIMAATKDGGFIAIKNNMTSSYLEIQKFSSEGVQVSSSYGFYNGSLNFPTLVKTNGGYVVAGNVAGSARVRLIKLDENGFYYPYFIKGNIFLDRDDNCRLSGGDIGFQRVVVVGKKTGAPDILAISDSVGRYNLNVDAGQYTVSIVNPNKLVTPCTPSVTKTISATNPVDSFDFPLKSAVYCGLMQVDIATPRLRRCFNNNYTVNYCNKGTAVATNAYVNITLDPLLEFISAEKPVASKVGQVYRFNLGDVAINDCRSFDIITRVRCGDSTRNGQTLCADAKIYPDTLCATDTTAWTGASLVIDGSCQGDSVTFQIRNIGRATSTSLQAITIENETARQYNNVQLAVNGVFTKKYPANGNTWRMSVNQQANHPRSTQPTAFVEGCRSNSSMPFATGFAANFSNDDADLSFDKDCQPIIGSFDPNDKIGYPLGTGTTKAIGQNQDIEYMIRFQNTGTDTAFTVVIRDTIDANMDIYSIEWGASSHKYKPEIYGQNIVKFTFDNILLVDSFRNEPKSNGYVKYRIKQKKDLAFGTKIQNSAGIYFDFNDPVLTNKTLHTVSKNVVTAVLDNLADSKVVLSVFPNPFTENAFFEFKNTPLSKTTFELYDLTGKRVKTEQFEGKTFEFHRGNLQSGIFFFKLTNEKGDIGTGKLIIQ